MSSQGPRAAPFQPSRPEVTTIEPALVDAVLPQTQCTKCGYAGCRPYAEAIAAGNAGIDRCPPGGDAVIARLAALTGSPIVPLDRSRGESLPRRIARIDPDACIGCTKCIQACPVDAIVGATRRMHAVVEPLCSGCELCVAPCPVDCIRLDIAPSGHPLAAWSDDDARAARVRHKARSERLVRERIRNDERLARKADAKLQALANAADAETQRKRAIVEAAIRRARERRTQPPAGDAATTAAAALARTTPAPAGAPVDPTSTR